MIPRSVLPLHCNHRAMHAHICQQAEGFECMLRAWQHASVPCVQLSDAGFCKLEKIIGQAFQSGPQKL